MQEMQVWSLGQEDSLEKEMATRPSILAQKIPWTEEPGGLQPMGFQELHTTYQLSKNNSISLYICTTSSDGFYVLWWGRWTWLLAGTLPCKAAFLVQLVERMKPSQKKQNSEREESTERHHMNTYLYQVWWSVTKVSESMWFFKLVWHVLVTCKWKKLDFYNKRRPFHV